MAYQLRGRRYLSISEAARELGVTTKTLRYFTNKGTVRAIRHPLNRYRLYRDTELRTANAVMIKEMTQNSS